ncbi:MAG: hypothetical protein QM759_14740 [Terricaulis sp.]
MSIRAIATPPRMMGAMRASRRPSPLATALGDGGFAIAAFACGLFDAPAWLTGLVAAGMLAYWSWSRRRVLNRLRGATWATQTGFAVMVLIAILVGSYWLGLKADNLIA